MEIEKIKAEIITLIGSQTNIINETQSFRQYVQRCQSNGINNEETVVQPFALSFLKILNYVNQHNLICEEVQKGNKPDYYSDNFILDCKSTKYRDFSERFGREEAPEEQLERYLKSIEFYREYGILFSFEKLNVFKLVDGTLKIIEDLSFSLLDFFECKSTNIEKFIKKFYVKPITIEEKILMIAETQKSDLLPIRSKIFNKVLKTLIYDITIELNSKFVGLDDHDDDTRLIREKVCQIKKQMDLKTTHEAEKEYISQTSYIVLARILLTKCWEDLGLIDPPNTYNGGFKRYIENYNAKIEEIYRRALENSQNIYFLFNPSNPYLLISLNEDLIVDILFQICKYDFNSLDYDILGYIYEDYLDLEHRKKFGQYYTPPYVVNLILDRLGYKPEVNKLLDSSILDPASGSGTFLLNAVRRVLQSKQDGRDNISMYKEVIENKIFGSELMLFPYLLSEINILIQISQLLKEIVQKNKRLNVLHVFPNNSFNLVDKMLVSRLTGIPEDNIQGDNIIDSAVIKRKESKLKLLQHKTDFEYVAGNPPYVSNDRNPELFREMRELFTFCNETYHNKMDFFYWFIMLGILKLKPGGKLGYITTRYWLDKGEKTGVETLKKFILEHCYIREIIDLRNLTVFISATGQENIIFLLERKNSKVKDINIRIFRIEAHPPKGECKLSNCPFQRGYCINDQEYLECLCNREVHWDLLLEDKTLPLNNYINSFYSAKQTSDLEFNRSWDVFYPSEGIIKNIIDLIILSCTNSYEKVDAFGNTYIEENVIKFVKDFFILRVGVLTTADEYFILSPKILKIQKDKYLLKIMSSINLKRSEKQELIELHNGIIDSEGYIWLELSDIERERLVDLYKTPSVYRHGLDESKIVGKLIFFEDESLYHSCPVLIYYLSQYKKDIEKKLEEYNELTPSRPYKWITLRRSASITLPNRQKRELYEYYRKKSKIFYNYRVGNDNIFGFSNKQMVAATDMYFFHRYGENINTYYMLAYLNSRIVKFYFKERPIELQRQKSNVENDIPIFIPRNEAEELLQKIIIKKERALTRKLQHLERSYRLKGFHFTLDIKTEDEIQIDVQHFIGSLKVFTIKDLSSNIRGEIDIYTSDREKFPILIINPYKIENIGQLEEFVFGSDVHFKYKSLSIVVNERFYEKVKIVLDSYFSFIENPKLSDILDLKIPSSKILEIINLKREMLFEKIGLIIADEKLKIENVIDKILFDKDYSDIREINSINKILHFIDLSFIIMMTPEYKEEILAY